MTTTPSLERQAAAVERAACNQAGYVKNLRGLVETRKRPAHELNIAEDWLPDLQAAAVTMRKLVQTSK